MRRIAGANCPLLHCLFTVSSSRLTGTGSILQGYPRAGFAREHKHLRFLGLTGWAPIIPEHPRVGR